MTIHNEKTYRSSIVLGTVLLFLFLIVQSSQANAGQNDLSETVTGTQYYPFLEWHLDNPTFAGNPFDLIATAVFTHTASGEVRTTEMFYDGGTTWKFRFSGSQTGEWHFNTNSSDPDLAGHSGSVIITPNPDVPGYITHHGNQWAWSSTGDVFVPQFVMIGGPQVYANNSAQINAEIATFFDEHGFNGLHTIVKCRWFDINQPNCQDLDDQTTNLSPDPATFTALEDMINKAYEAGGIVHIWQWGDGWETARFLPDGINGIPDLRLQRYIAARLGPIPGWTMGYGFDVYEWADANRNRSYEEIDVWHDNMQDHMGWAHFLGARAYKEKIIQLTNSLDYASYEQHKPTYETYVQTIDYFADKPAFSEDRFRIREPAQTKDYTMLETRRGLWHATMAGGVANIWGNLIGADSANAGESSSAPYPNPEWIRTWADFFAARFVPGMVRCNDLTDGVCLQQPDNEQLVFYKEDAKTVAMDLSGMSGDKVAVAVDTALPYMTIDLGMVTAVNQTWTAPYQSDWAIAVGFPDDVPPPPTPTFTPTITPTATLKPTATPTFEITATFTPSLTSTPILSPTATNTPIPTNTPSLLPTETHTPRPTNTPALLNTATNTPAPLPTATSTPPPTSTPTPLPTNTPTPLPTSTQTPLPTTPPTATSPAACSAQSIMFVGRYIPLPAQDQALVDHLEALGHTVELWGQGRNLAAHAGDKDLVIISDTIFSNRVGVDFQDTAVPILTWETGIYDELGFVAGTGDVGSQAGETDIIIADDSHPLAAGLNGTVTAVVESADFAFANPAGEAAVIAHTGTVNEALLFAYETNAPLASGTAPARRVGTFNGNGLDFTADGWLLFEKAVAWSMGCQ